MLQSARIPDTTRVEYWRGGWPLWQRRGHIFWQLRFFGHRLAPKQTSTWGLRVERKNLGVSKGRSDSISLRPVGLGRKGRKHARRLTRHLIGTAFAFGGNPEKDAFYLNITPRRNDGATIYKLDVKDVPVDAFWSISVYNAEGYFEKNAFDAYTINNITAKKEADGSVAVQFGGCDGRIVNCLPTMPGWNYMVRLYRPRAEILNGTWKFPQAQPVEAGSRALQ